jgi:hypothetical protein
MNRGIVWHWVSTWMVMFILSFSFSRSQIRRSKKVSQFRFRVPVLQQALNDSNQEVRDEAAIAMRKI